jgi:Metallopeptidase toxin 2
MRDANGNDEYWEIDQKTGEIKMTKSDWVSDDIWIKDKDGVYKKLHEIKIEFKNSTRKFDMGVLNVLGHYTATSGVNVGYTPLITLDETDDPENLAYFDPNNNSVTVPVVNGYISEKLTNMFNLQSTLVDHERLHEEDFSNRVRTNKRTHLEVYIKQMEGDAFVLINYDYQAETIALGLDYLFTMKEDNLTNKEDMDALFARFFKETTSQGWIINVKYDPNSEDSKVVGFDLTNKYDDLHVHYQPTVKKKNEEP